MVLARGGEIGLEHLPSEVSGAGEPQALPEGGFQSLARAAKAFERDYLLRALALTGGKRARGASGECAQRIGTDTTSARANGGIHCR